MREEKPELYDYQEDAGAAADMRDEEASLLEQKLRAERRIDEESRRADAAERESRVDSLTGLPNRRAFVEQVAWLDSFARRHPEITVRVDFIDLRGLADYNDVSPETGDQALREMDDGLRAVYRRKGDYIARLGGDEFGVLRANNDPNENILGKLDRETGSRSVAGRPIEVYVGTVHWKPEGPDSQTLSEAVTDAGERQSVVKRERKQERKNDS